MSSIRYLAVDFRSGTVYGLSGDRTQVYTIGWNNGGASAPLWSCTNTSCDPGQGATTIVTAAALPANITLSGMLLGLPSSPLPPGPGGGAWVPGLNRFNSFFVNPEGDEFEVSDLTSRVGSLGGTSYTTTLYRAAGSLNTNQLYPIVTLPVAAVAFSK